MVDDQVWESMKILNIAYDRLSETPLWNCKFRDYCLWDSDQSSLIVRGLEIFHS